MRIRGWSVDGFGIFQDYDVRDLPDGLTVFHGANEAGKSTLLAFLRGMLFGFPDRRAGHARYPPLNGGRHGGRLTIEAGDTGLVIDRDASRKSVLHVSRTDGRSGSAEDLDRALAGADEQLFRSIFAFSLTELQTFESLTVDGIRDRIFTAGIAGAGRSARAVIESLEERSRTLLRRSSRARITLLVAELNRVRDALEAARAAAEHYRDRIAEEEGYEQDTRRLAEALTRARRAHEHTTTLIELWPTWSALRAARSERDGLALVAALPADAEVRLATLEGRRQVSRQAEVVVARALADAHQEHDCLGRACDDFPGFDEIETFYRELPLRRDRLRALRAARERLAVVDADVAARLSQLGPDWNEARFATCIAQQPAMGEVRFWEQQLAAAAVARARATNELQGATRRLQELSSECETVRARLPARTPPSVELLNERDGAIRRLRGHIVDLRAVQSDAEASERVVTDSTHALRAFEAATVRIQPRWIAVLLVSTVLGGAAVAGWRESLGDRTGTLIAAGATFALTIVVELMRRWAGKRERQRRAHVRTLVAEIDRAMQARDAYRTRAAALRAAINVDRDALELTTLSYDVIDEEGALLQRQRAERARWDEIVAHVGESETAVAAAQVAAHDAADQRAAAERACAEAEQGWAEWLRPCGLDGAGAPTDVIGLLAGVDTCRQVWAQRESTRVTTDALAHDVSTWEAGVHAIIAPAEPAGMRPEGEECCDRIGSLHERWVAESARRQAQARCAEGIATRATRAAEIERERQEIDAARVQLFRESGASDEEEFRRHVAAHRRGLELERIVTDGERHIAARVGDTDAQTMRDQLAAGDVMQWEARRLATEQEIAAIEVQRDEAVRGHHDARRVRRELEDSAAVATLEADYEGLRTELDRAVDEWRVTTNARALIEETLREFERTRQPAVLAEAGKVLAIVTSGRYTRVLQDDDRIIVLDQNGGRKGPHELSRGTVEQLYLCVRLGLAAEFGRRSARLPIIMDDVLVNFDPERARALAAALAEFAATHQVLFFTCQPAIRDLLVDVGRASRVVEMAQHAKS